MTVIEWLRLGSLFMLRRVAFDCDATRLCELVLRACVNFFVLCSDCPVWPTQNILQFKLVLLGESAGVYMGQALRA